MLPGVGVFGTEPAARILVPILREFGFNIEALWGNTASETESLAADLKIDSYTTNIDDVLLRKNVDLVFVVCPPYLHSQISVKALGIGKHVVVCSGNLGLGQNDALKMTRASLYYPSLIALTSHTLRFLPGVLQMRKLINDQSYLGEKGATLLDFRLQMGSVFHDKFDWLCDATMGGGILNLFGSHLVDVVTFLTQQKAIRVNGVVRTYTETTNSIKGIRRITAPDFANFQMELANGALVTVTLHSHQCVSVQQPGNFFSQELMVCGKDGSYLALRGNDLYGQRTTTNGKEEVLYVDDSPFVPSPDHLLPRTHVKGLSKMVAALREAFLPVHEQTGWIKSPVECAATFVDGLYVQAVLDAIRKSNEEKKWVPVHVLSDSPTNQANILHAVRMSIDK